ncbi:MAG: hypothetical protein Q9184_001326 [Pyrenodesmia sp. 2 TL-2023]
MAILLCLLMLPARTMLIFDWTGFDHNTSQQQRQYSPLCSRFARRFASIPAFLFTGFVFSKILDVSSRSRHEDANIFSNGNDDLIQFTDEACCRKQDSHESTHASDDNPMSESQEDQDTSNDVQVPSPQSPPSPIHSPTDVLPLHHQASEANIFNPTKYSTVRQTIPHQPSPSQPSSGGSPSKMPNQTPSTTFSPTITLCATNSTSIPASNPFPPTNQPSTAPLPIQPSPQECKKQETTTIPPR